MSEFDRTDDEHESLTLPTTRQRSTPFTDVPRRPDGPRARPSRRPLYGLLVSTAFSVTGNAMVIVLIPWLVLERTGNAASAGLVNSASLAAAAVALIGGAALLDRWNRLRFTVGADLLSAVAVAALPVVDGLVGLNLGLIAALVAIGALFDGPGRAARESLRPEVAAAGHTSLDRVNALGEVMDAIGFITGPALAGAGVATIGLNLSLWVTAGFLALAALAAAVAIPAGAKIEPEQGESYFASTIAGFRHIFGDPVLRSTAITFGLYGFLFSPMFLVLTAYFEAADNPTGLGGVVTALGVGGLVGAVGYTAIADRFTRRRFLTVSLTTASIGLLAMAFVLESVVALAVAAAVTGFVAGPINPVFSAILQDRAPENLRGRVLATIGTLELLAAPAAVAIAGIAIEATSPRAVLIVLGAGFLLATAYAVTTKGLRAIESVDLQS